mmetsp:Transcript_8033/g.33809  ORF Transcript_8033/g.33809 Transcript_8033/m.33809 type:complete len:148 (-) Transcript_8033:23-466(-)
MMARLEAVEEEIRSSLLYVRHTERELQQSPEHSSAWNRPLQLLLDNDTGLAFHGPWLLDPRRLPPGLRYHTPETAFVPPMVLAQYALVGEGLALAALLAVGFLLAIFCGCGCCCLRGPTAGPAAQKQGQVGGSTPAGGISTKEKKEQ